MALKTKEDLLTLDVTFLGEPFCQVSSKSGLSEDYTYLGEPFTYFNSAAQQGISWHYNDQTGADVMFGSLVVSELLLTN